LSTDARVARGLGAQLARWRERLAAGERRLGWKIGLNLPAVQEALGISAPVIGALTSGSRLEPGAAHSLAGGTRVGVEPEIAIHMATEVAAGSDSRSAAAAIGALGPAIEVVDIDLPFEDLERILAGNVFHRAVMLGPADDRLSAEQVWGVTARVLLDGSEQASARVADAAADPAAVVRLVADLLGELGETLAARDVIISGSLTPIVWVKAGDRVAVDLGPLGRLETSFTPA
jgi:2-keto-4-pentenoate hydratase